MAVKTEDLPPKNIAAHWNADGSYPTNQIPLKDTQGLINGTGKANGTSIGARKMNGTKTHNDAATPETRMRIAYVFRIL